MIGAAVSIAGLPVLCLPAVAVAADAAHPTVVELFQSQGCSSCPPANANVLGLAERPDILALSWQVTYWDNLGWKDTFAKPEFTRRQWDYAQAFGRGEVATPEVIVNGSADVVGNRRGELEDLIRQQDRGSSGPSLRLEGGKLTITGGAANADVLLVRYNPNIVQVAIGAGENGGRTLPHRNVVREFWRLGAWHGGTASFLLPSPGTPGLKTAVLVQAGPAGPVLAAAHD